MVRNIFKKKQAAMFGLEGESLRKQFGKLFLARLQRLTFRLVEGHQATWPLNSKGAMFGLDARIALAIFGALSVITGASLYSAIQDTQIVSMYQTLNEFGKALESYYIDTGENLPLYSSSDYILNSSRLISNIDSNQFWGGPYLSYDSDTLQNLWVSFPGYKNKIRTTSYILSNADWSSDDHSLVKCTTDPNNCYEWVAIDATTEDDHNYLEKMFNRLDKKYDNSDGRGLGSIRIKDVSANDRDNRFLFRLRPFNYTN